MGLKIFNLKRNAILCIKCNTMQFSHQITNSIDGDQQIWFCVKFRRLCEVCLAMPLIGLVTCLAIAVIFQFEHIHETACKVC